MSERERIAVVEAAVEAAIVRHYGLRGPTGETRREASLFVAMLNAALSAPFSDANTPSPPQTRAPEV
jgi:hypothetical protein